VLFGRGFSVFRSRHRFAWLVDIARPALLRGVVGRRLGQRALRVVVTSEQTLCALSEWHDSWLVAGTGPAKWFAK